MNSKNNKSTQHHITPLRVYYKVWGSLIVFTIITVTTSYMNFGIANLLIALLIASAKALLVILFFMGLKYEGKENNVTFFLSFTFLSIFICLTLSDLLFRVDVEAAKVEEGANQQQATHKIDVKSLIVPTPVLLNKAKELYAQQCVTCHGAQGKGDGQAAAALNPKPRNFTADLGWKFGRTISKIFDTLTKGSPGTAMPPFSGLTPEDRLALAHYVRSFMATPPSVTSEETAVLEASLSGGAEAKPQISIAQAMEKMTEPESVATNELQLKSGVFPAAEHGAQIYQKNCLSCHGMQGQGVSAASAVGVNPVLHQSVKSFAQTQEHWLTDKTKFVKIVSQGLPGGTMPGFALFSQQQWNELFQYVQKLAMNKKE